MHLNAADPAVRAAIVETAYKMFRKMSPGPVLAVRLIPGYIDFFDILMKLTKNKIERCYRPVIESTIRWFANACFIYAQTAGFIEIFGCGCGPDSDRYGQNCAYCRLTPHGWLWLIERDHVGGTDETRLDQQAG